MLIYGCQRENTPPTVIDYKLAPDSIKVQNTDVTYRFKPTTLKSIVKSFSFNLEMSNLVAGRTVFNSGKFLTALKAKHPGAMGHQELPPDAYKAVDNSTFGNADGWYSINNVELKKIEKNWEEAIKESDASNGTVTKAENSPPETTTEATDFPGIIKSKSKVFLIDEKDNKNLKTLIYTDKQLIQDVITKSTQSKSNKKPVPTPIAITLTIDGFSGFSPGQYFNVDGIPEIYNTTGVFQIMNTKHNISKDGWVTTLEADWKVVNKK
jgi:hypothetical protein